MNNQRALSIFSRMECVGRFGHVVLPALAVAILGGGSCSRAAEPGVPLESVPTPRIRPGLWTVGEVLNGRRVEDRSVCVGDRRIAAPHWPTCDAYTGRFIAPNTYLISGACQDGPLSKTQDHQAYTGDLQSAFTATSDQTESGLHSFRLHTVSSYRFVGACPPGMPAENGSF